MRTTGQIGLALVAVIALVAGVTYLSHYGPSAGRTAEAPAPLVKSDKPVGAKTEQGPIGILTPKVEWSEPGEGDIEVGSHGYHDFWFRNGKEATRLGLDFKNCKCTDVKVLVLDKAQYPKLQQWFVAGATTILAGLQQGPLACISLMEGQETVMPKLFGLDMNWQVLEANAKGGVPIPAEGGGIIRVRFEGRKDLKGAFLLKAGLWVEPEGSPLQRTTHEIEMPLNYVDEIQTTATAPVNMEAFNANDEKTAGVMVYSSTRAGFDLYVTQVTPSPLVDVQINELNRDEIADYVKAADLHKRVLAAKRVSITVRERTSDSQRMDLGPFYRKFLLSTTKDEPEPLPLIATGEIRGELVVGGPGDRGRVELKTFRSSAGINKTVTILAQQPGLELDANDLRVFPENLQAHMKVRLEKVKSISGDKRGRWHLHVELKPGFPPGKTPEGSAVFLKIAGSNPPRQIRIPIIGMATQ